MLNANAQYRILEAAIAAPSGDNLQPWQLEWHAETLHISVDLDRGQSLYNFQNQGGLIALGALIENIVIASQQLGFTADVQLTSAGQGALPTATVSFRESLVRGHPLFDFITRRCTNRKPYAPTLLKAGVVKLLQQAIPTDGTAELHVMEDPKVLRIVAKAASLNDRLLLESRRLHDDFFASIRWTEEEAERTRDGLYTKTLELTLPIAVALKAFSSWSKLRFLNWLGASRMVPLGSYQAFLRSPAFGFLQMTSHTPQSYVEGGRLLQRVWLTATSLGLSFQPMSGMIYLMAYRNPAHAAAFSQTHQALLTKAEGLFKQAIPLEDGKAAIMLFRIGYGAPPSATSLRRPVAA